MKKGDIVKFRNPLDDNEIKERYKLLEDPDGGRVLVEGICDLPIRPTRVLLVEDLELGKEPR
jgi:hypothetical protein